MKLPLIALMGAVLILPAAAQARPGNHPGHPHGGPPGLQGRVGNLPPGQARHEWSRGQKLPASIFATRSSYVVDPAAYNLQVAPAGYQWVRVDNDVYLVQTRTGVISDLVLNLIH